ncbi:30S ribosomal protein S5 [Candidatus Giovannonibacteria bacterium RIFCSPHIGHO2_02_FULL_46_20]|uniref:Small ribosomal subunit protein uS5 n=1 Tax=Candidatus Giovannonibacteria bacterium RIFCSPHIGHO2_02_FULL_46_20 TaxID=1798338 RepID=A0A1F5WFU7_9BACT|nr:MAG: 30S ribosomal protein S5 [Candidatus Giovannonibacteria bacterium RIFCSPHIGHO2_02_FULL_46_20]
MRPQRGVRSPKQQSEYQQKLLDLRRVARVVAGGRRFSFRALLVIGDQKGRVGVGVGKAADTSLAIEKAFRRARKNIITVLLTKERSIPHEVAAKYASAVVIIKPGRIGKGLVAGGAARVVLAFAGIENASAKALSHTKNKINNARATIEALRLLRTKH